MQSVYLVFLTELENEEHVLLFKKNPNKPHKLLRTNVTHEDFLSASISASKIILDYLNNIQLQNFTFFKKEYLELVDFKSQEYAENNIWTHSTKEEKHFLRHLRNIQSYLWALFFNQCPLWNDDDEKNFYYIIRLQQQDLQYMIEQKGIQLKFVKVQDLSNNLLKYKNKFLELQNNILSKDYLRIDGRIILHFNFKAKEHMVYEATSGYLDTVSIYNGIFRRKYDNWNQYNVAFNNNYPSDEILRKANFIIMPGNRISVYSGKQWITDVKNILLKVYETNKKIKILGVCFGFQILTEALGGKVEKMKKYGFVHGNTILKHNVQLMKSLKLFQGMDLKQTTIINQAHGDEIVKHPDYFLLLSTSDSCKNEVMISKDERLLMFQGHPEYSSGGMRTLSLQWKLPSLQLTLNDAINDTFKQYPQEQDAFHLQLCLKFLKQPL